MGAGARRASQCNEMHDTGDAAVGTRGAHVWYVNNRHRPGHEQRRHQWPKWHTAQHICNLSRVFGRFGKPTADCVPPQRKGKGKRHLTKSCDGGLAQACELLKSLPK
jgi:hypothetical protein